MDAIQTGIITLLKSAITGEKLALPDEFDIDAVYDTVHKHHMQPLIYAGAVNCGISPEKTVMQRLFQDYFRSLQLSERQMQALNGIFAAFDENEIDYLPLKGCLMKAQYPKPELRMMADADVLIRPGQYAKIVPIMESLGFKAGKDVQRHIEWNSDALFLELHKCQFTKKDRERFDYFGDGWVHAKVERGTRYKMDEINTFAYQFAHFATHFASAGIGCRHVVELWVYLRSHPHMDMMRLESIVKKLNLWKFYLNIQKMLSVWFEGAETDEKTEFFTQFIFSNGSWGTMRNAVLSAGVKDMGKSDAAIKGRLMYVWHYIFPPVRHLKKRYPILNRAMFLIPVMWFVRLVVKTVSGPAVWRSHIRKLHMLNADGLKERREFLKYVGLHGGE